MALKPFIELVELDLTEYTQKKPTFFKGQDGKLQATSKDKWLDYIEWAVVLKLLYLNGAEKVGFSSKKSDKDGFLTISLHIDQEKYELDYPIIDGNAVIQNPNQFQIHKAELRGFVKCVAINSGLGLSLWMKEEDQTKKIVDDGSRFKPSLSEDRFLKALESINLGEYDADRLPNEYNLTAEQLKRFEENRLKNA